MLNFKAYWWRVCWSVISCCFAGWCG